MTCRGATVLSSAVDWLGLLKQLAVCASININHLSALWISAAAVELLSFIVAPFGGSQDHFAVAFRTFGRGWFGILNGGGRGGTLREKVEVWKVESRQADGSVLS